MDNSNSLATYTDAIGKLAGSASSVVGALNGGSKAAAPAPAASKTNWGLIAGIGGAVVLVLVLVMTMGGRK